MKKRLVGLFLTITCSAGLLSGCASTDKADLNFNEMKLEKIEEMAKEEGAVNSVGMPDTWANWGETWTEINSLYAIEHTDLDMSSAEEIAMFKEEGTDATNDALVETAPTSFADILEGDYKVTIGDVSNASQAQHAILATAYAMGGDIDNLQPAYDFWMQLAEQGRIDTGDTSTARIESGEIAVGLFWDYNSLNYRDNAVKNNPDAAFTINIPSDGSVQSGYASIINVNAPNPAAACLSREYILSDEGQINLAIGYATPIREKVEIPAEVQEKRIPAEQYASAIAVQDFEKWTEVCKEIITYWEENIIPAIQ